MKKDVLKILMDDTLEKSKELLLRDGYVAPVAFIFYGDEMGIIPLTFKNDEYKERQIYALREMARVKKADAVFIVMESWYVTSDKKDLSIVPSKHPMRKECIFVVGECEEGDVTIIQKFERKEIKGVERKENREKGRKENRGEIVFGEKDDIGIGFSKFNFGIKKIVGGYDRYEGYA